MNDVVKETGYSLVFPTQRQETKWCYCYSDTLDTLEDIHVHLQVLVEEQNIVDYKKENELLKTLLKEVWAPIVH
ncbi:MAG: hypothetical protein PHS47_06385 [Methanocellales archaeon]|nr:hypothetical protein [Methanocellales archaeon]MDD3421904.1 hypothetical protein [Methanocellales archaeon]